MPPAGAAWERGRGGAPGLLARPVPWSSARPLLGTVVPAPGGRRTGFCGVAPAPISPAVAVGGAEAAFVCAGCRGAACSPPCLSSRHRCGGEQQGGRSDVSRVGAAGWYRPASRTLEDLAKGCQIRLVSIAVEPGSPFLLFVLIAIPSKSVNRGFCSCPRMRPVRSYLLEASCQKSMMRLQSAQCSEQV